MIFKSTVVVRTASYVPNILPIPSVNNIMKNITLHNWVTSIVDMASVNAMNVNPVPWATFFKRSIKLFILPYMEMIIPYTVRYKFFIEFNENLP